MRNFNFKSFILGVVLSFSTLILVEPLTAAITKTISVQSGVNIYVDDVKLDVRDANGKSVEVFIYNGTTYLPVRAVSQALNKAVSWDGKTQSVYLGSHDSNIPVTTLDKLDYFNTSNTDHFTTYTNKKDVYGTNYSVGMFLSSNSSSGYWREYAINGMYSRMKGRVIISYNSKGTTTNRYFKIYGDGQLLYSSPSVTGSNPIVEFDVDISNVLTLRIEGSSDGYGGECYIVDTNIYQ